MRCSISKFILVIGVMVISITGCSTIMTQKEKAIELLNKKYNDSFVVKEVQNRNSFGKYYTVIAYQENNPDMLFRAEVDFGGGNVSDNYVSKILCQKISNQISQNLGVLKETSYIFTEPMIELTMLDNVNITVEEYMEVSPVNKFVVYLNFCPEGTNAEEIYKTLQNAFKGLECVSGQIQLYIMDEGVLNQAQNYRKTNDALYDEYHNMVDQYMVGIIKVKNGKINPLKEEIEELLTNNL